MQKYNYVTAILLCLLVYLSSCNKEDDVVSTKLKDNQVSVEQAFPGESGVVRKGAIYGQPIEYEEIGNHFVFEGDIILNKEQLESSNSNERTEGTGRSSLATRWPGGVVYYTISPSLPDQARVTNAIAHWEANTHVRFQVRTSQRNYITFRPGSGCSSYVGMTGGQQFIDLASGCSTGNTIHEIGHAVGLWHEQSRADRGNFISINYANVESGTEHNFRTYLEQGSDGFDHGNLDFGSIMMYSSYAFSSNGQPTITRLDGSTFNTQRNGLSTGDIACAKFMYPADWSGSTAMTSLNGNLYVVQGGVLVRANPSNGHWDVLGSGEWSGTTAMTFLNGYLYIVQGGALVRANPNNGDWAVLGSGDWSGTTAMTSLNGYLYIVQGGALVRANPSNGDWAVLGSGDWSGTTAMSSLNGYLYIVQGGALVRANPNNGDWAVLGSGDWTGTTAMTSLNNYLYIVQGGALVRATSNGDWAVIGSGNWSGTTAMTSVNGTLYIIQGPSLVRTNPNDGGWEVL